MKIKNIEFLRIILIALKTLKTALYHHRKSTENDAKFSEYIVLGVPLWQQTVTEMQKRVTNFNISLKRRI
jgi:hypothetical protein